MGMSGVHLEAPSPAWNPHPQGPFLPFSLSEDLTSGLCATQMLQSPELLAVLQVYSQEMAVWGLAKSCDGGEGRLGFT